MAGQANGSVQRTAAASAIVSPSPADCAREHSTEESPMNRTVKNGEAMADHATGYRVLHNPRLNKGTAFTEAERRSLGLEGLLPAATSTIELQVARRHAEIAALEDDLQKYLVLSDLQARNETLYYAVLMSDPATYMPIVYTPTVGEACQKFD